MGCPQTQEQEWSFGVRQSQSSTLVPFVKCGGKKLDTKDHIWYDSVCVKQANP